MITINLWAMCVATFKITLTILVISVVACCLLGGYFDEDDTPLSKAAHAAGDTVLACFAVIGLYAITFIIYLIWTI